MITITINNKEVPVEAHRSDFTNDELQVAIKSDKFIQWVKSIDPRFRIKRISVQSIDLFGPSLGFLKFNAEVYDEDDNFVPGIVFMRGSTVAVAVVVANEDLGEFLVLLDQKRFPVGDYNLLEIPAGMVDEQEHFAGAAARELKEETGISIEMDMLHDLGAAYGQDKPILFCPGGTDEAMKLYSCFIEYSNEEFEKLEKFAINNPVEGEYISVKLVPLEDAAQYTNDLKSLLAISWLQNAGK